MRYDAPKNTNYTATVVRIGEVHPLATCDNVVGTTLFGFQAIVGKNTKPGDIGVVFTAESKLSTAFMAANNLHRDGSLNADESARGYLEANGRVKALKFRGHRSDALFVGLESFAYLGINPSEFSVGDTFDGINGNEIVEKYVPAGTKVPQPHKNAVKKFRRVDEKFLPEHYTTDNYWRNCDKLNDHDRVVVTQKLHGTSIRIANTYAKRKLTRLERLARLFGVKVQEQEIDHVYGSRKVIKDPNNPDQNHFYNEDLWSDYGATLDDRIPKNFIVYGELIGWTPNGQPIQKNYTYRVPFGEAELYVYRVAVVTEGGMLVDLGWEQVRSFCAERGLKHVPELFTAIHGILDVDILMDRRYAEDYAGARDQLVPLDGDSPVDEGVVVRADRGFVPEFYKAKAGKFFEHETAQLDADIIDLETEGSTTDEL